MYTALLLEIYLPVKFQSDTSYSFCVMQNIRKFSETTGPTKAKFHVAPPWDRRKDGKLIHMIEVIFAIHNCQLPGAEAFSRDFTTNLAL